MECPKLSQGVQFFGKVKVKGCPILFGKVKVKACLILFWKLKVMRGPIVLEKYNWKGAHFLWKYQHIGEKGDGWPLIGEVRTWWQEEKAKANLGIGPLGSPVSSNDSLFIKGIFSYSTVELWGVTMWTLQNIDTAEMSQAITSLTIFTCLSIVSR